jgi:hypothetical protein
VNFRRIKNNLVAIIICWWLPVFLASDLCAQAPTIAARLAIIAEAREAASIADMLTVSLSRQPQISLLERGEIERVYREQNLAAAPADFLKLGQVLGADGLVVVTPLLEGTNRFLLARLVAARPGVVITEVRSPWPSQQPMEWANGLVEHFKPLLPKLTVLPKDAVPISVLNLRSAVQSAAGQSIEKELTVLLIHRLTREREVFVLERQYMSEVLVEQKLQPEESPFWTGRYLLDGVVDQDGFQAGQAKLNARLVSAGGGAIVNLEVSGSRTNLAGLTEALVGQILKALHREGSGGDWQPLAEAEQYRQEANWALRWGLSREARAASESAWTLGLRTKEVALLRVLSYADGIPINYWYSSSKFNRLPPMPDESKLRPAIKALELLAEALPQFATNDLAAEAAWLKAGADALNRASGLLENYHRWFEARAGVEESLALLRASARRTVAQMPANLTRRLGAYANENSSIRQWQQLVLEWHQLRWNWGGLWFETPEEAALLFLQVLEEGWHPSTSFVANALPRFAAWSWPDRIRIPAVEKRFLQQLKHSSNENVRLEGFYLSALREAPEPAGYLEAAVQAWTEELWRQRKRFFEGEMDETVLTSMMALVRKKIGDDKALPIRQEPLASFLLRLRTDYLTNAAVFTYEGFRSVFPYRGEDVCDAALAQQLLPLFGSFGGRFATPAREASRYFLEKSNQIAAVLHRLPVDAKQKDQTSATQTNELESSRKPIVTVLTPLDLPWSSSAFMPQGPPVYQNGKLWLLVLHHNEIFTQGVRAGTGGAFISVDLRNGRQDKILLPEPFGSPFHALEVTEDYIYGTAANRVFRYQPADKSWDSVEAPIPVGARIQQIHGRFFLTTADSILRFDPTNRSVQVLASARRRPAMNPLDQIEAKSGYNFPQLFPITNNEIGVVAQNRMFIHVIDTLNWRESELPFPVRMVFCRSSLEGSRYLMRESQVSFPDAPERLWGNGRGGGWELLLQRFNPDNPLAVRRQQTAEPLRWEWPARYSLIDSIFSEAKGNCWALAFWPGGRLDANFSRLNLLRFEPGRSHPLAIELQFEADNQPWDMRYIGPGNQDHHLKLLITPEGVVVTDQRKAGYWVIPHATISSELDRERSAGVKADNSLLNSAR